MRFTLLVVAALFLMGGVIACDKQEVGANMEQAGAIAAQVGQTTGMAWLSLAGSALATIGAVIAGKKATVGKSYAEGGWSPEEIAELVAALKGQGYTLTKA